MTRLPLTPAGMAQRVRNVDDRTPLRIKLVAALLLLVMVALALSGIVAVTTMRDYLVSRVDDQLRLAAPELAEHAFDPDDRHEREHGLPSAFVIEAIDADGTVLLPPTSNLIDAHEPLPQLPPSTSVQARSPRVEAFTVPAERGSARWRVLRTPTKLADSSSGTLLVAQSLDDVQRTVTRLETLLWFVGAVASLAVGAIAYFAVRTSLRPLRQVEATAAAIAAGDLGERVPPHDPRTEVGRLSTSLNGMLAQIESAFAAKDASETAARKSEEKMRRFAADASHELRTPLTSIRGFAELYRQGAVEGPDGIARLMRRIEDEATRMGLLVDDMLLLARLDQHRPLEQQPVDMLMLAGDAVHDARAVAPGRRISLQVGDLDAPPIVAGDDVRLRQVLANLLANALQHTPPGSPIEVRLRCLAGAGDVEIEVADHGPGMTADAAAHAFERFYRTDTVRSRADGGTGLGLSIAQALVAGHGGEIELDTAPGQGATFRLRLPRGDAPAQQT